MFDINQVIIVGNVTKDAEFITTSSGVSILNFSVANNNRGKDDPASFFECVAFKKTAENLRQYIVRGQKVVVQGSLKQESWTDKTSGAKRSKVKILCNQIQLLGSKDGAKPTAQPKVGEEPEWGDDPI
jgi:single-strand DNA-binding protein